MNQGEYGDRRRYGATQEDWPDNPDDRDDRDDYVARRQRMFASNRDNGAPHWQAGSRQPPDSWSTSPETRHGYQGERGPQQRGARGEGQQPDRHWSEAAYGEGRYGQYGEARYPRNPQNRGGRDDGPERRAAAARHDPERNFHGDWHQGGEPRYRNELARETRTLRDEWGTGRGPTGEWQGESGYIPFAGRGPQWEPLDFGQPEHVTTRHHRPTGPKGYQRSDARIQDDVCERLAHSHFDVHDIEVSVAGGIVTLSGQVRERGQKYRLEEIADGVFGVRDVDNQVRVGRTQARHQSTQEKTETGTKDSP
ncbi:BON domain-containing protein [Cupriavidus necator]|uniref:Transport-associated protein n=1 Tax=Cupriavidus pinatubonensis (strain JMP 134 / LMG 1197) TaxID=264198 RepID=Q46T01_CUPPJ|nr:BON domain-containing protein [Cupriavidus necator]